MTFEQQARLMREKQDRLIKKYEIAFGLVFSRQLRKFSRAIGNTPYAAVHEIDNYFPESDIKKVYDRMIIQTANEFRIKDPDILVKSITDGLWSSLVNAFLGNIGGFRITEITKTTKDYVLSRLRPILTTGIDKGLGIADISKLIQDDISEYSGAFAKYRSTRIARTEIIGASNWASHTSVETSGVKDLVLKKWLVTVDGRERETHLEMINKPAIPIDDFFEVRNLSGGIDRMKYPGDISGSAGNTIQCRCTIVYQRI